jgi:hypothetical protein
MLAWGLRVEQLLEPALHDLGLAHHQAEGHVRERLLPLMDLEQPALDRILDYELVREKLPGLPDPVLGATDE